MRAKSPEERIADRVEGLDGYRPPDVGLPDGDHPPFVEHESPGAPFDEDPNDALGPSDLRENHDGVDQNVVRACAALDHSDTDNGKRLRNHFGRDLVIVAQEDVPGGGWAVWAGTHWDMAGGVARSHMLAQRVGGLIALEAEFLQHTPPEAEAIALAEATPKLRAPGKDAGDEERAAYGKSCAIHDAAAYAEKALKARKTARWKFAITSKNKARYENMLAAAAPHLRTPAEAFNADPYLVACLSHTLRFARVDTGEADPDTDGRTNLFAWRVEAIADHRREDLITALVPHAWTAEAKAPLWRAFVEKMLPDEAKRRTVQQFSGASLLGVPLQFLMFHYGLGANGKSVFLETLTRILGDSFAIGLPAESIVGGKDRGAGAASPDIARLFGKRMVRILEIPEGKPLQEDLVKRLTGGERFPVRNLFKGFFEFVNRAKPHMSGNGFPTTDGTDYGIWRRLLVVHWDQTIPPEERREFETVVSEMVAEGPGVLAWLVEGALDFLLNGLVIAPAIKAATDKYQRDMDPIGEWIAECLVAQAQPEDFEFARDLFDCFTAWCETNAKHARSETKFGREIGKRFNKEKKGGRQVYVGAKIRSDAPRPKVHAEAGYAEQRG